MHVGWEMLCKSPRVRDAMQVGGDMWDYGLDLGVCKEVHEWCSTSTES